MSNPYETQADRSFWRTAVATRNALDINELWTPRFNIETSQRVITFGSCFAQHIGRALAQNGFNWWDGEVAPARFPDNVKREFSYGVFSARTGNIYTAAMLRQWVEWAFEDTAAPDEFWQSDKGWIDPFRPDIEPGGFESEEEARRSRQVTLDALRRVFSKADVLVFTMGLTEGWKNLETGVAYPMCPGTVAGTFDPASHGFVNYRFGEIYQDMRQAIRRIRSANSRLRVLLTVSPVPLTATASDQHVVVATSHSKSVLRAVAGELTEQINNVDYFPSYEIITAFPFRGMFFEPNLRSVNAHGVAHVMKQFFSSLSVPMERLPTGGHGRAQSDVVCEEEMLDAFGRKS
ncbi:MAG: GSCFA domain-containing protein [Burkholderiaceae bacterium]|nr:GSCFA domain-containing protein [Rhodoferax sp.]MCP5285813.1 GSCFA domain-containing protein [Burkholderiaceae bacterium]